MGRLVSHNALGFLKYGTLPQIVEKVWICEKLERPKLCGVPCASTAMYLFSKFYSNSDSETQANKMDIISECTIPSDSKKMTSEKLCLHYKYGHCKFRDTFHYYHPTETCEISSCVDDQCLKGHPRKCRFYQEYKRCKFAIIVPSRMI